MTRPAHARISGDMLTLTRLASPRGGRLDLGRFWFFFIHTIYGKVTKTHNPCSKIKPSHESPETQEADKGPQKHHAIDIVDQDREGDGPSGAPQFQQFSGDADRSGISAAGRTASGFAFLDP